MESDVSKERIVVVEDNPDTRQLLEYTLNASGFEVFCASDGEAGLKAAQDKRPSLVVLDLMLPGMDGLEVCRRLKQSPTTSHVPVIMLTAKAEEVDRIVGLELGADDYMTKPFSPRELALRVRAVLRRAGIGTEAPAEGWTRDGLSVDFSAHTLTVDNEDVALTATEFKLLSELIRHAGKVRTRDTLLDTVWDTHFEGYSRTVDTHIRRLRQKLGPYADWVETVRGVGYRFTAR
jgi:two-component system phosphate regulon response regulator PhoB